jgi:hypothetical protein
VEEIEVYEQEQIAALKERRSGTSRTSRTSGILRVTL